MLLTQWIDFRDIYIPYYFHLLGVLCAPLILKIRVTFFFIVPLLLIIGPLFLMLLVGLWLFRTHPMFFLTIFLMVIFSMETRRLFGLLSIDCSFGSPGLKGMADASGIRLPPLMVLWI